MDGERRLRAKRLLREGETMLWTGVPDPAVNFTPFDAFFVPFSLLWTGMAAAAALSAVRDTTPFALFPVVFVAVGLYMVAGRFLAKKARKKKTVYVLTDRRAIVAVGDRHVFETPWVDEPRSVRKHRDGRHVDVVFGTTRSLAGSQFFGSRRSMPANTGLDALPGGDDPPVAFYDVAEGRALLAALERPV